MMDMVSKENLTHLKELPVPSCFFLLLGWIPKPLSWMSHSTVAASLLAGRRS